MTIDHDTVRYGDAREYCLLWVPKRAVSMRRFFRAPKTCVKTNLLKILTSLC